LKNKNLSIVKINNLGLIYLDVYLLQAGFPDAERFFNAIQYKSKESQAILAVFFGQAEACLVTDAAFNTMKELNPQVGRKLRVMAESPDVVDAVGFFRKDYPQDHKKTAIKGMHGGIKSHERGKQIMLLFNVDQMDPIGEADIDSVRKLLAGYDRLKK
jgi:ABC-type phosphate/phosphonate transport system substrate-binding protein